MFSCIKFVCENWSKCECKHSWIGVDDVYKFDCEALLGSNLAKQYQKVSMC